MKTYMPKEAEVKREWLLVDATDQILGRLASKVAKIILRLNHNFEIKYIFLF